MRSNWLLACMVAMLGCPGTDDATSDSAAVPNPTRRKAPAASRPSSDGATPPPVVERKGPPMRRDGTVFADTEMMGTHVSINVWIGDETRAYDAGEAIRAAMDEMSRLEQIMSEWRPDSDISLLSASAGGPARKVVPELLDVLARSREIAEATDGMFDPTFHGVGQLWSFKGNAPPPSKDAIADKLPLVGWERMEVSREDGTVRLVDAGMQLGLGAIGKGFAADRASALLVERGFANHVVEVGGDTYAAGTKNGKAWMVGIQKPDGPGALGALPTQNEAVVTSGDYQRFFEYEGKRYAHILDPRTGWPVPAERSPKSVTMVARNATDADAFCTAVAVMGVIDGQKFVESREDLEAVIITQDDEMLVSSGLRARLVLPPKPPTAAEPPNQTPQ